MMHNHDPPDGIIFNTNCQVCGTVCCYADDSSFSISRATNQEFDRTLSEKYKSISELMSSNKLTLNSDKTHLMHFSPNRPRVNNDQNN